MVQVPPHIFSTVRHQRRLARLVKMVGFCSNLGFFSKTVSSNRESILLPLSVQWNTIHLFCSNKTVALYFDDDERGSMYKEIRKCTTSSKDDECALNYIVFMDGGGRRKRENIAFCSQFMVFLSK